MKKNLLTLATLPAALGLVPPPAAAAEERPNILFIIADDQSPYDLKAYDPGSRLETPVLDRLASRGMVLDAAHHMGAWAGAVCTASRHMVMSGRTVWHVPDRRNSRRNPNTDNPKLVPPNLPEHTLAAVFNRAGYDTMRTCKKGNSYEAANAKFTVRHDATKRGATDETGSAWHAERVLEFLDGRERSGDEDPFLIYFGFSHPHDVRDGTPELLAKYGAVNHTDKNAPPPAHPKQPPLPANYLPAHPFPHGHPRLRDEVAVRGVWQRRDERTIRNEIGRQFACVENIDIQIGRVLDKLEAMGELENTYVFYTADHGMAIGRHGLQGKQNLYEHTWRVPFLAAGPGIAPGSRAPGNIYLLDVLATLCDLAGVPAPETNEGVSFAPVLKGAQKTVRDVLYGAYSGGTKPGMRCVKKGNWKLIKYDVLGGEVRRTQLFNLADNPDELLAEHGAEKVTALTGNTPKPGQRDLAGDPAHAEVLEEMEALLLSEMRRLHDPFRLWDQPGDDLPAVAPEPARPRRGSGPRGERRGNNNRAGGGLPLVFREDFEAGRERWEVTDEKSWTHREVDGNKVFGINRRQSDYRPKVRSPYHIALAKDVAVADFVLTFRVRSTKDTGGHRDCCVFFNYQDPQNFYYVHLGARPDPASGQIMIVQDAPRTPLTKNEKPTPWGDGWHRVKVVRDSAAGTIEVYFDDMETPHMRAVDKTFGRGRIGIGSFDDMNDFDDIVLRGK